MSSKPRTQTEIGAAIREARGGLSIRELARRSNISPGQISRIEAGEVDKPSQDTLLALARALGTNPDLFLVIAGHLNGQKAHALLQRELESTTELSGSASNLEEHVEDLLDETGLWPSGELPAELADEKQRSIARSLLALPDSESFNLLSLADYEAEAAAQIREIASAWPALTEERRKLTLAFIADQEVLARLDRLPNPRGRYDLELQLSPREEQNGQ